MDIKKELNQLKSEIDTLYTKEKCECGKTLAYSRGNTLYIKCKGCGKVKAYRLDTLKL